MSNCYYSSTERVISLEIIQQVQKRMLVSLAQIAKDIDLHEGDYLAIEERDGGIFLRPVTWIDKSQAYIWTKEWQEKIRRSEEDMADGNYQTFENMEDCINDLEGMIDARSNKNQGV